MPEQMYGVRCVICDRDVKEFQTMPEAIYQYGADCAVPCNGRPGPHVIQIVTRLAPAWTVLRSSDDAGDDL